MLEDSAATERWLPVVGYEGHYEVSYAGRVRSLDRTLPYGNGFFRKHKGVILAQSDFDDYGHKGVVLSMRGVHVQASVHRLALTAFIGPCTDGLIGCHNNGDPADNRLSNLRWDTYSENNLDRVRHGNDRLALGTTPWRGLI